MTTTCAFCGADNKSGASCRICGRTPEQAKTDCKNALAFWTFTGNTKTGVCHLYPDSTRDNQEMRFGMMHWGGNFDRVGKSNKAMTANKVLVEAEKVYKSVIVH